MGRVSSPHLPSRVMRRGLSAYWEPVSERTAVGFVPNAHNRELAVS